MDAEFFGVVCAGAAEGFVAKHGAVVEFDDGLVDGVYFTVCDHVSDDAVTSSLHVLVVDLCFGAGASDGAVDFAARVNGAVVEDECAAGCDEVEGLVEGELGVAEGFEEFAFHACGDFFEVDGDAGFGVFQAWLAEEDEDGIAAFGFKADDIVVADLGAAQLFGEGGQASDDGGEGGGAVLAFPGSEVACVEDDHADASSLDNTFTQFVDDFVEYGDAWFSELGFFVAHGFGEFFEFKLVGGFERVVLGH